MLNKKEKVTERHLMIQTEKLKELILENHSQYKICGLKTKINIVKKYAEFDNDTELLEFLIYMEEE